MDKYYELDTYFSDGAYVIQNGSHAQYNYPEVCKEVERIGRPLTDEELQKYYIGELEDMLV